MTGAVTAIWQVLLLMFLVGWFVSPLQAAVVTILQTGVVDEERGRVMSVLNAAMSSTTVLSMAFAGIAGEIVGVRTVFFLAGGIVAVGAVISLIGFRASESRSPEPEAEPQRRPRPCRPPRRSSPDRHPSTSRSADRRAQVGDARRLARSGPDPTVGTSAVARPPASQTERRRDVFASTQFMDDERTGRLPGVLAPADDPALDPRHRGPGHVRVRTRAGPTGHLMAPADPRCGGADRGLRISTSLGRPGRTAYVPRH